MKEKIFFTDRKEIRKIHQNRRFVINFLNSHDLFHFRNKKSFRESFQIKETINLIDGFIISLYLSITNLKIIKRFSGPDFVKAYIERDFIGPENHLFLGIEKKDLKVIFNKTPNINQEKIFFYNPPYIKNINFPEKEIKKISKIISTNKIDFVWVGLGCPKQNILSYKLFKKTGARGFFNVGAALDFLLGKKKRAPKIFRVFGLEWFYRLLTDFKYSKKKVFRSFLSFLYLNSISWKKKKKILFLGRFPPPLHGASKINDNYFKSNTINRKFLLKKVNIGLSKKIEDVGKTKLYKISRVPAILFQILGNLIFSSPDIIYFEISTGKSSLLIDSIYVFLCKMFKKKIIFQIHGRGIEKIVSNNFWLRYYKNVFRKTKMILLSKLIYPEVREFFLWRDVYILPNGIKNKINDEEFNFVLSDRLKKTKPTFLFISNMRESKGVLDVLKICNSLNNKKINFECLFVGPWQDKRTEEKWNFLLDKYNLKNKCIYLGPKYGREKENILKKSNMMIFPTKYDNESFPIIILEAFMFGIPVFAYDNGAIREIVSKEFLGFVSEEKNWNELEKVLENRLKKNINYKKIREEFKTKYTLNIAEQNLGKIFEEELK